MTPRLTSAMLTSALIRRVHHEGGSAMVIAKGDETSGSVLILTAEKGRNTGLWERLLNPEGLTEWLKIGPQDIDNEGELTPYIERRRRSDPDIWVVELDIPNAERFVAELPV